MNLSGVFKKVGSWRLTLSVLCGLAAGGALAALMRLAHRSLTLPSSSIPGAATEFVGILAVYFAMTVVSEWTLNHCAEAFEWDLRRSLTRQILEKPLLELEQLGIAPLLSVVTIHVKTVSAYLLFLPGAVINFAIVVGCFAYIAWLSPLVFALNLAFLVLAATCYLIPEKAAERVGHAAHQAWDRQVRQIDYYLHASRLMQLSRAKRRDFTQNHFEPVGEEVQTLNARYRMIHLFAERFAEVMVLDNLDCLLFVLPRYVDLPLATLTGLVLAALFARPSLKSLLDFFPRTQGARLALRQMSAAGLDPLRALPDDLPASKPSPIFRELAFDRVTFAYANDHDQAGFTSGPFSFTIRAGELVFIVGGNGAGKTTLAKLISGLYPPLGGTITLDGENVTDDSHRGSLRERVAAVYTEDPLFSHLLGVEATEIAAQGASLLETLRIAHKTSLAGTQFSTTDLSQGQRRRLSLLNALLEKRPILILDEWAADQDPEFRHFFYVSLLPALRGQGKTIILITHDDRYFAVADRLIRLDGGALAA